MSDKDMRSGMNDFMSNVEMTSNVLKISMEEAAALMKKAVAPTDVALLAMLPEEQRKAIEAGFQSVNAQGNPMSETLAKRLAAGSRGAFLQTAEYQEMAQTAPGREVLNFVEQMANTLETGSNEDFQSALAQGFPELATSLIEMTRGTGVGVQLLNDPQLAGMVGSIIEASQNYGGDRGADAGTTAGARQDAEGTLIQQQIQIREALVLSEAAMNTHMENFIDDMMDINVAQLQLAREVAITLETMSGITGITNEVRTFLTTLKDKSLSAILSTLPGEASPELQALLDAQSGYTSQILSDSGSRELDSDFDKKMIGFTERLESIKEDYEDENIGKNERDAQIKELLISFQMQSKLTEAMLIANKEAITAGSEKESTWEENVKNIAKFAGELNKFTKKMD
jgi:hypothetical protein